MYIYVLLYIGKKKQKIRQPRKKEKKQKQSDQKKQEAMR